MEEDKIAQTDLQSQQMPVVTIARELPHSAQDYLPESIDDLSLELFTACKEGKTATAQMFIDIGADVDQPTVSVPQQTYMMR